MDNVPDLEQLLIRVRELAIARLERFSQRPDSPITQSFLFRNDLLLGVRFRAGLFRADWFHDQPMIRFYRGDQQIDQLSLGSSDHRHVA